MDIDQIETFGSKETLIYVCGLSVLLFNPQLLFWEILEKTIILAFLLVCNVNYCMN